MILNATMDPTAFVAPGADLIGRVTLAADCSVFFHATLRAEQEEITVGRETNIQDNAVLHISPGHPLKIGANVTVGHGAILHGCTIGDGSLIGMGAIVLDGAIIGAHCLIGAGALVTQATVVPDNTLMLGCPAKAVRQLDPDEIRRLDESAAHYVREAAAYREAFAE